jgi:hypothetical protein
MQALALRGQIFSEEQMPTQVVVWRRITSSTPDESGGNTTSLTPDASPVGVRIVLPANQEVSAALEGELFDHLPNAVVRAPLGTGLARGDELRPVDISLPVMQVLDVRTAQFLTTTDERAQVFMKGPTA